MLPLYVNKVANSLLIIIYIQNYSVTTLDLDDFQAVLRSLSNLMFINIISHPT